MSGIGTRHPDWYLDDGNLICRVKDTLFRVHRSVLVMHSNFMKDTLSLSGHSLLAESDGDSDANPVFILIIDEPNDFAMLLSIMYGRSRISSLIKSSNALVSLLVAAHKLQAMMIFRDVVVQAEKHLRHWLALLADFIQNQSGNGEESRNNDNLRSHSTMWTMTAIREVVLNFSIDSRFRDDFGLLEDADRVRLQRARSEVTLKRMQFLSAKITGGMSARLSDPSSLAILLPVLPVTSRDKLLVVARELAATIAFGSRLNFSSYNFVQAEMESWLPPRAEEFAVIDLVWKSFDAV
ncbi:hypothetical protein BKA62DRAFT_711193 [Auriculariales sp. MPI-PUGE-AT-0066]|nr:hypothetical protein BKA62DRAFT_711193 [Auriculariales sp. MPI-PUGE-AT-0066]